MLVGKLEGSRKSQVALLGEGGCLWECRVGQGGHAQSKDCVRDLAWVGKSVQGMHER